MKVGGLTSKKACHQLVAEGITEHANEDHYETFSPIVKITTIRCTFVLAIKKNCPIHQLDTNNAIFNCELHEEVYMKRPSRMVFSHPKQCFQLIKSLD
ncbi:hypothetical protein OSB04_031148, partial [Centaurea solstitialis]